MRLISRFLTWTVAITMLLAFAFLNVGHAFGQGTSAGTVVGTVTDATGAIIPGTIITLTEVTTKTTRKTVSNESGQFVVVGVSPG